jgi:hypothetical protein
MRKRRKPKRSSSRGHIQRAPRTAEEYFSMSPAQRDMWDSISQVPARMRSDNTSLGETSRGLGVSLEEVVRLARPAFRKLANGQYAVRATDQIFRMLPILSTEAEGLIEFPTTDSREASVIGRFWNRVSLYLRTGDPSELKSFERTVVKNACARRRRASEGRTGPVVASTSPTRSSMTSEASWSANHRNAPSETYPSEPIITTRWSPCLTLAKRAYRRVGPIPSSKTRCPRST